MAQTTTKSRPVAKAPPSHRRGVASSCTSLIDRAAGLSEDVLKSVETGQHSTTEAVRKFVDSVDGTLPHRGEGPSKRQEVFDSAMEMTDRLVDAQHDFIRKVIDGTARSLSRSDGAK